MATILVRGIDEGLKGMLMERARHNGRSMEAEVRDILASSLRKPNIALALMESIQEVGGIDDLPIPEREERARTAVLQ
ncbi:FitA-like ribbon-helix-helix domain-containing protein [Arcanobacterium haemolyticum]